MKAIISLGNQNKNPNRAKKNVTFALPDFAEAGEGDANGEGSPQSSYLAGDILSSSEFDNSQKRHDSASLRSPPAEINLPDSFDSSEKNYGGGSLNSPRMDGI